MKKLINLIKLMLQGGFLVPLSVESKLSCSGAKIQASRTESEDSLKLWGNGAAAPNLQLL
jgi:hypothetical protein